MRGDEPAYQRAAFQRVLKAQKDVELASERLRTATQKAFPKGCIVLASLGGHDIQGEVIGYSGHWWHEPDAVWIKNIHTGKQRKARAAFDGHNVTFLLPPQEATR